MEQKSYETYRVGKVKVERLDENIYKMVCSYWVWTTGSHFVKAIVALSKTRRIRSIYVAPSWVNYILVFTE